ncbi:Bug family tripartite tricarboxylate transporter substrate binding protein [Roseomonas sp. CCTCC AB2023176]|uniref:Bug family tripartite tricarboxylate transporter substrate binding protein n=1 Tax=Roseomonas sp. CCTCC AB2023176 TaxID=3342640 RepID=UPI0035E11AE8
MSRRWWLALVLGACWAGGAAAQGAGADWRPERPVRLIVGYAAGTGPDVVGRVVATALAARLGQPVVVENRVGAGGTIGTDAVAKAAPDGTTVGLVAAASIAVNPHLMARLPYDPLRDLTPVAGIAMATSGLVVHPSVPARTPEELRDWLRAQNGRATCNGATVGSLLHMAMAMAVREWGVDCPLVHGPAGQPSVTDTIAGRMPVLFDNLSSSRGAIAGGQLRLLAVTSATRSPAFPDVPAMAESLPGFEAVSWFGLFGPRGLSDAAAARLEREMEAVRSDPEVVSRLANLGVEPLPGGREALGHRLREEYARWGRVIRENNIRME